MRTKDGESTCERCGGKGCYQCGRTGKVVQCPSCLNDAQELVSKSEDEYRCHVCGTIFLKTGKISSYEEYPPKPDRGRVKTL